MFQHGWEVRHCLALCSGLSFQKCLDRTQPWKVENPKAKGRHAYCPMKSREYLILEQKAVALTPHYRFGFLKLRIPLLYGSPWCTQVLSGPLAHVPWELRLREQAHSADTLIIAIVVSDKLSFVSEPGISYWHPQNSQTSMWTCN